MSQLGDHIFRCLEWNERLVPMSLYKNWPWVYDQYFGPVIIFKDVDGPMSTADFCMEDEYPRIEINSIQKYNKELEVLGVMAYVSVYTPTDSSRRNYIVSSDRYQNGKDCMVVLEKSILVLRNDWPGCVKVITESEYNKASEDYEVIDILRVVRPKEDIQYEQFIATVYGCE